MAFPSFLLLLISNDTSNFILARKHALMLIFPSLLRVALWLHSWSILDNAPNVPVGWRALQVSLRSSWFTVLFNSSIKIFWRAVLSIIQSRVVTSPFITVQLPISLFPYVSFCFMYFLDLLLTVSIFISS